MKYSQKIWKYMDLAKFISLLSEKALYFACPSEFHDPFEGYMPKSWAEEYTRKGLEEQIERVESLQNHINNLPPTFDFKNNNNNDDDVLRARELINKASNELDKIWETMREEIISERGVSCWYKSDDESEAMWKLYSASGQGIAIESTIGQLKDSIINKESLEIISVHYIAENNPGKYNGKRDPLSLKRKSFEHEKEMRAVISLKTKGKGTFVKCDLDKLINHIHISPLAEPYFSDVIENICKDGVRSIDKPVIRSTLFDKPNYTLKVLIAK